MSARGRLREEQGSHALVDTIPFAMPVATTKARAMMAVFPVDPKRAAGLLPAGGQLRLFRMLGRAFLMVTVIDYQETVIGKYIEFSVGLACTFGTRVPAPLSLILPPSAFGQFVFDLPVSTEISVKGGRGIWGMPKHQASLDFLVDGGAVSSQYDLDGALAVRLDIEAPPGRMIPLKLGSVNYAAFRGMLFRSAVFFDGQPKVGVLRGAHGSLTIGDHPRLAPLKQLGVPKRPIATIYYPRLHGLLDDHVESWFLRTNEVPAIAPEGFEQVIGLGQGEAWLAPPNRGASKEEGVDE
jgi:hypothetical protein